MPNEHPKSRLILRPVDFIFKPSSLYIYYDVVPIQVVKTFNNNKNN